jgi:hypothetical protein
MLVSGKFDETCTENIQLAPIAEKKYLSELFRSINIRMGLELLAAVCLPGCWFVYDGSWNFVKIASSTVTKRARRFCTRPGKVVLIYSNVS